MGKITQDEYLKISDLLHSENVKEIMEFMSVQYAGARQEYCDHLLGLIPQIAQANVKQVPTLAQWYAIGFASVGTWELGRWLGNVLWRLWL